MLFPVFLCPIVSGKVGLCVPRRFYAKHGSSSKKGDFVLILDGFVVSLPFKVKKCATRVDLLIKRT